MKTFVNKYILNIFVIFSISTHQMLAFSEEYPELSYHDGSSKSHRKVKEADYVIVGLGTSGAVLARYLSDPVNGKFSKSVIVLEAGQNRSDDPLITQGLNFFLENIDELAFNPKYSLTKLCPEENVVLAGAVASEQYSSGRQWFGSSAHNFMAAVRGSSDRWDELAAQVGNNAWSYNQLLPSFKFLETFFGTTTEPADRGTNGPLQISQIPILPTIADPFAVALSTVTGAPIISDYNVPDGNIAVSSPQYYNTPDFNTRSFGLNFLPSSILSPDGKGRHGRKLRVYSGAVVSRVVFNGNKAIGVEYFLDNNKNKVLFVKAKKQVILCAGAPLSSAILQRSGVGPSAVLRDPKVNVDVVVDNPLVGTGLKEHYGVLTAISQPAVPFINIIALSDGRNFFPPAGTGDGVRRFQTIFQPNLVAFPFAILNALSINPFITPGITTINWYLRPKSSGTSYIVDANFDTLPDIRYNLYTDGTPLDPDSDITASIAAFYMMQAFAHSIGSTMIFPPESHFADPAQLAADAGGLLAFSELSMTNHYSGTCNMGTNISNGVVSGTDLHVFGTKRLMVADCSIFPFPETGNTAWQAYVAGIRAAQILGVEVP